MTAANRTRFEDDLKRLISEGRDMTLRLYLEADEDGFLETFKKNSKEIQRVRALPRFGARYQLWYSQAKAAVSVLLPQRLADFVELYEPPRVRKTLTPANYVIADFLRGLSSTYEAWGLECALAPFQQQVFIIEACLARLDSSLFEIRELVQADLFDSEFNAADALSKAGFQRAAGAWFGVLLERHLKIVSGNHGLRLAKKSTTLADFNEGLRAAGVIDMATWRLIQRLADIRNLAAHHKEREPTKDELADLSSGVRKVVAAVV